MNQIVSLFMFSCGDYEKVKQDVWEENWKAMRLYSVVALVAFGVITLVSVFSLSIGKFKWVYLVYTFLSLVYFCISRCQLRSFLGKKLVVYSFFAALLLFGIITGTLITPEELTVNYIVFMMTAPLLFTARTAVMNGLILSSMLLYIGLAFFAQHNPILSKNLVNVILYGVVSMLLTATMMRSKLQRILYHKEKETLEVSKRESQERILNYERFLTDMVRYAASEENPDKVLNQLVEYIGQRVTADRAYIFEQNDRGTFDNTYEWCKAGVSKEKDNLQDVPYEGIIETWFAQYQESNNVIIHDIEECKKTSEAIYERLKPQGVNTLVTGPIKINGKMVGFKASAAIPRIYRLKFQRDIYKDLSMLEKSIGDGDAKASNLDMFSLEMFENIAFIMAKHADPTIPDTPEEWLDQFNTFSIYQILPQLIELWGLNVKTDVEAKKNFAQQSVK